ncbi:MAG TPA: hypothetical protein VK659_29000 [Asanoa sp.]|nr:hypothetical protein [Asanoa sp.]
MTEDDDDTIRLINDLARTHRITELAQLARNLQAEVRRLQRIVDLATPPDE